MTHAQTNDRVKQSIWKTTWIYSAQGGDKLFNDDDDNEGIKRPIPIFDIQLPSNKHGVSVRGLSDVQCLIQSAPPTLVGNIPHSSCHDTGSTSSTLTSGRDIYCD